MTACSREHSDPACCHQSAQAVAPRFGQSWCPRSAYRLPARERLRGSQARAATPLRTCAPNPGASHCIEHADRHIGSAARRHRCPPISTALGVPDGEAGVRERAIRTSGRSRRAHPRRAGRGCSRSPAHRPCRMPTLPLRSTARRQRRRTVDRDREVPNARRRPANSGDYAWWRSGRSARRARTFAAVFCVVVMPRPGRR